MDLNLDGSDLVFIQQDTPGNGVSGKSFDDDDPDVFFYRSGGIEYDCRNALRHYPNYLALGDKQFDLSGNISVETTLEIAQSVEPMID